MKNILLVFTGGTIGSSVNNGTIKPTEQARFQLLEQFEENNELAQHVKFTVEQPISVLSENLQPSIWSEIIQAVEVHNLKQFDGVIVTHGTDTLAYTAAALGMYFNWLDIPLLLVSSNYPLAHKQANGLQNFICAVDYICQNKPAGVWVAYQNPGQNTHIHVATRLLSCLPLSGDFISALSKPFMQYASGQFKCLNDVNLSVKKPKKLIANFTQHIPIIRPYPGLNYDQLNVFQSKVVLHDLYHSGTACVASEQGENSLLVFARECQKHRVKLYLSPVPQQLEVYDSMRQLMDSKVEFIFSMSLEAAYAKLLLAYANFDGEQCISQFLHQDLALEHVS